jgi:hypothetical protein
MQIGLVVANTVRKLMLFTRLESERLSMILDIWVFITMMLDELGRIQSEGKIYG